MLICILAVYLLSFARELCNVDAYYLCAVEAHLGILIARITVFGSQFVNKQMESTHALVGRKTGMSLTKHNHTLVFGGELARHKIDIAHYT